VEDTTNTTTTEATSETVTPDAAFDAVITALDALLDSLTGTSEYDADRYARRVSAALTIGEEIWTARNRPAPATPATIREAMADRAH